MKKLEREDFLRNEQVIHVGYGNQKKDDNNDDGPRRLKFVRFKISGFDYSDIDYTSSRAQTCSGRS